MTKHEKTPLRRLLAMLLCIAVLMSLVVPAMAAEDEGAADTAATNDVAAQAEEENAVRLPITIRDAYADNILFNSNRPSNSKGLVAAKLGSDGLPVYNIGTIQTVAEYFVLNDAKNAVINKKTAFDWDGDGSADSDDYSIANINKDLHGVLLELLNKDGWDASTTATTVTPVDNLKDATSSMQVADWMLRHLFADGDYTNTAGTKTYQYTDTYAGYETLVLAKGTGDAIYDKDGETTITKDCYFYDAALSTIFHGNNGSATDTDEIANGGSGVVANGGWFPLDGPEEYGTTAPSKVEILNESGDSRALGLGQEMLTTTATTVDGSQRYYEHNYHTTTVGKGQFIYHAEDDLFFQFDGDDDVYMYINGYLLIDLGGTHSKMTASVWLEAPVGTGLNVATETKNTIDASLLENAKDTNEDGEISWAEYLGLEEGGIYSFDFFQMERCAQASNFAIYTNIKIMDAAAVPGKTAYLGTDELAYGTMVPENSEITYGFSLANTSTEERMKISDMTFTDSLLGVSLSKDSITLGSYDVVSEDGTVTSTQRQFTDLEYVIYTYGNTPAASHYIDITSEEQLKQLLDEGLDAGKVFAIRGFKYNVGTPTNGAVIKNIDNTVYTTVTAPGNNSDEPRTIKGDATMRLSVASVNDKSFVIDYAKPLSITNAELFGTGEAHELDQLDKDTTAADGSAITNTVGTVTLNKTNGNYGTMALSGNSASTYALTYTPMEFIDGVDTFGLNIPVTSNSKEVKIVKDINIIPANNVYYEDDFVTTDHDGDGKVAIEYTGTWSEVTEDGSAVTAENNPKENGENHEGAENGTGKGVHGWEDSLANDTGYSDGSAHKADASQDSSAKATFTFTGTGVDIYSRTNSGTGTVIATLKGTTDSGISVSKGIIVDNKSASGDYYQIPTLSFNTYKVTDEEGNSKEVALPHGTYTVTIKVTTGADDNDDDVCDRFIYYLDGIRVYNPVDDSSTVVADAYGEKEVNAVFTEVRDILLDKSSFESSAEVTDDNNETTTVPSVSGAVFIDEMPDGSLGGTATTATIGTYKDYGPKNEVYLAKGQAVTFKVEVKANQYFYIGLKSPNLTKENGDKLSNIGQAKVSAGDNVKAMDITHSTDMYYEVQPDENGFITIQNIGDGLLSVTKIRTTGTAGDIQFLSVTEEETLNAAAAFSARTVVANEEEPIDPEEPETPVEPETPEDTETPTEPETPDVEIENPTEPETPEEEEDTAAQLKDMLTKLFKSLFKWFR